MSEYAAESSEPVDVTPEPDTSASDGSAFESSDSSWDADYPEQGADVGGVDNPVLEDDWDDEELNEQPMPDLLEDPPSDWAEDEVVDLQSDTTSSDQVETPVLADDWDDEESVTEQPLPDLPNDSQTTEVEQPLPDLQSETPVLDGEGVDNAVADGWNDEVDLSASDSVGEPSVEELTEAAQAEAKPTSELKDEYDAGLAEQMSDSSADQVENPVLSDDWDDEESVSEQSPQDLPEEALPEVPEESLPDLPSEMSSGDASSDAGGQDSPSADELTQAAEAEAKPTSELQAEYDTAVAEPMSDGSGDEVEDPVPAEDDQESVTEQSLPDLSEELPPAAPEEPLPDLSNETSPPDALDSDASEETWDANYPDQGGSLVDVENPVLEKDFHDAQSAADVGNWLGDVNPNYTGDFDDPYSVNCGKCAESVFNKFEGNTGVAAAGQGTYTTPEMQDATGVEQVPMSPSEIEKALVDGGPGSHALIGVDWEGGGGHWYNAYYDGDKVWAVDGQTGEISPWPGVDPATVKNWDAGIKTK